MSKIYSELAFEEAIEKSLIENGGYVKGDPENFDKTYAVDTNFLFWFLKNSQSNERILIH